MLKISIILPNFNGGKYLEQSIKSFLDQDYENKELIIVDGKSNDNSHEIIEEFSNSHSNIIWIKDSDKGISNAFNIGLNYAKGDVVGYLGSDDIIYKNLFSELNYINSWSTFDAVYFNSYTFYINEKKCLLRKCPEIQFNLNNLLSYGTIVGWQNIYFKKEIYDKYVIDESNKTCMDYEFYLRICSSDNILFVKSDNIATINIFDGNISTDTNGKQMQEAALVAKKYADQTFYKGNLFGNPKIQNNKTILMKIKHFFYNE